MGRFMELHRSPGRLRRGDTNQRRGPAGLRAEALRLEEANHQPQRRSARNPHRL